MAVVSVENSQKIKNMSILCAILVVTIHVSFPDFGLSWLTTMILSRGIAPISVPFFFVISGFFLAGHFDDHAWYKQELQKRISSLLVPFLIWIAIATCLITPLSIVADVLAHRPFGTASSFSDGRWMSTLGLDLRTHPKSLGALWYVRCLLIFVVLSPIFKSLVQKLGVLWLFAAFLLTLFHMSTSKSVSPVLFSVFYFGFSLSGVFYFSFGIWLNSHINCIHAPTEFKFVSIIVSILFLCTHAVLVYGNIRLPIDLTTIAIPFMMFSVWSLTPSSKWPNWFTSCSFPLFLMHQPLIPYISLPIKYSPIHDTCIGSAIILIGSIAIPMTITVMLKKHFPKLSHTLFAGRA